MLAIGTVHLFLLISIYVSGRQLSSIISLPETNEMDSMDMSDSALAIVSLLITNRHNI